MGVTDIFRGKGKKDLESKLQAIQTRHPVVPEGIARDPARRADLIRTYTEVAKENRGMYFGGKLLDYVRKLAVIPKTVGDFMGPGIGWGVSGLIRLGEFALKGLYSAYYTAKTGVKKGALPLTGAAAYETLGWATPVVGNLTGVVPIYSNMARSRIEDYTA